MLPLLFGLCLIAQRESTERPNVIVILADDLGYETIGANGGTSYQTPILDRLAGEGARFEHCYAQPLCTPTRVQLMTGALNVRNYTTFGEIDPKLRTFAHLFREAGYKTGIAVNGNSVGRSIYPSSLASMSIVFGSIREGHLGTPILVWSIRESRRIFPAVNTALIWWRAMSRNSSIVMPSSPFFFITR